MEQDGSCTNYNQVANTCIVEHQRSHELERVYFIVTESKYNC